MQVRERSSDFSSNQVKTILTKQKKTLTNVFKTKKKTNKIIKEHNPSSKVTTKKPRLI